METKKIPFFIKVKKAIFNFEEYHNFAMEKIGRGILYYIIIMIIFSMTISIAVTYKMYGIADKLIKEELEAGLPDFRFENNELIIEEEEKIVIGDENYFFGIILNPEESDIENIEYDYTIIAVKDKVYLNFPLTEYFGNRGSMPYEYLSNFYDLEAMTKQSILEYLNSDKMIGVYIAFFVSTIIYKFVVYAFMSIIFDVLLLTVLGLLVSKIFKVTLKIKQILNISFYAMTLSILLYMIYLVINNLIGFEIKNFRLAYETISYIYMITAILMIKTDVMKQQMELMKIAEVQKQVRQELEDEERRKEEEERQKKEEKKKEETQDNKEKKKGKKETPKGEPEGSKA